jgi:1-deoxy-D-xylulose-5-phosphate reductoisomerase
LRLAIEAIQRGGTAPALLNAANEAAVAAFLDNRLRFTFIPRVIEQVLAEIPAAEPHTLEDVQNADQQARELALTFIRAAGN